MKRILLISLIFIFLTGKISGQISIESVQDSINNQLMVFPQEKIHLHTDRNFYVPGEKIWFKAYIVNAVTHQALIKSHYVYVELISADSLVERVMIRQSADSLYYGNIFLSDIIPEGSYTLRAYTRYMDNMGEEYFFKKNIRIGKLNLDEENDKKKKKKSTNDDYDVTFYPESGNLPEGKLSVIAFKSLNKSGGPEDIKGTVIDGQGTTVCDVTSYHAGMGIFTMQAESNREYFLKCKNSKGKEKQFKLPQARNACSIKTSWTGNNWFVSLVKSPSFPEQELYLLAHCRGIVFYFAPWNSEREYLSFSKKQFPSGVIQILLLDRDMNPLSERLIFNKNSDEAIKLVFSTDKPVYEKREKVNTGIHITDNAGNALSGNLSVAITDDRDFRTDTATTILSSLLLSSELKGHIDNAAWYLQNTPQSVFALDLLMMIHGWRRYDVPETLKGKIKYPEYAFENTKYITGQVKSFLLEKPVENGDITMLSSDGGFGMVTTNSMGYFSFYGFDFPDSTKFFIKASNKKGSERVLLSVNPETFPQIQRIPDWEDVFDDDSAFIQKAEQRAQFDDDMRVIHLPEIVITGKKKVAKRDEVRLQNWMNAGSDATIYREDIEKRHAHRVSDLLLTVAGVRVSGNGSVTIRGASGPPIILIDGIEADAMSGFDPLEMVNVEDIESIDVFKGANAAIFGMRGANGAISITTRRGSTDIASKRPLNYASITPLGFQKPVEFYSPKYETLQDKRSATPDYRTTIFWKPDVRISGEGKASFEFYTADFPTTYSVIIEGISSDGQIIRQEERIEVK